MMNLYQNTLRFGGNSMIENIVEFFRNLPQKQCMECGEPIKEQHECYGNKCDGCMDPGKL